jgi:hypothetical protein
MTQDIGYMFQEGMKSALDANLEIKKLSDAFKVIGNIDLGTKLSYISQYIDAGISRMNVYKSNVDAPIVNVRIYFKDCHEKGSKVHLTAQVIEFNGKVYRIIVPYYGNNRKLCTMQLDEEQFSEDYEWEKTV